MGITTGTVDRTSVSCEYDSKPSAFTTTWYGLNGTFAIRKLPSLPVVASRRNPLTGFTISTVALGTTPPDGSLTTPSIEPEFPNCARMGSAQNKKLKLKTKSLTLLKPIWISPPTPKLGDV